MSTTDDARSLSSQRKALFDELIGGLGGDAPRPAGIAPRPSPDEPAPQSYTQQRLWFYAQLEPDLRQYHIPVSWHLEGDLDVAALRAAFDGVQERHESLRTRFVSRDDEPLQVVDAPGPAPVEFADLRADPGSAEVRAKETVDAPFDLAAGPCWRGLLARTGEDEYLLVLVIHHIVFDGWSVNVFLRDLVALYDAARGRGQPPEPLAIQFPDYAVWEREQLRAGRLDALLAYWREQMDGAPEALELRTDRPRPERFQNPGAVYSRTCDDATVRAATEALCAEEGATPFMAALAAFGWVLARHASVRDLVLGTPVANRSRPELEDLVGFFTNTVLLRLRLDGLVTFRDLLRHAREVVLGAFAHQELPFDALVEDLRPSRDPSRNPLFQVVFTYVAGQGPGGLELDGVRVEPADSDGDTTQFDMALVLSEHDDTYKAAVRYSTMLFDEETIAGLVGHLFHLLGEGVRAPDARLDGVALATPQELAALRGMQGDVVALPEVTLWQAVVAQAERTPDLVALTDGQRSLSYRETVARAEVLARHLVAAGVGLDVPVGLCLQRSFEQVLGLLGVLAAGGGFLPILPQTPAARVAYMLEVAGAGVCLTDRRLAGELPDGVVRYVCVDDLGPTPGVELPRGDPDALAALYFTSGSTGEPKGVACHHRNWLNVLSWQADRLPFGPGEGWLLKASLTFDMAAAEIFAPLLRGGFVGIGGPEAHRDPVAIVDATEATEVTLLSVTPSLATLVLDEFIRRGRMPPKLRVLLCGGEAVTSELVEQFRRLPPSGCVMDNHWGPTETSVVATAHRVDVQEELGASIAPIGLPMYNVVIHVLDEGLQPLPPRVPGEIYVSGVQVGRGYVGQPGLTAERFLPDPLATEPGTRMYCTGDLGWRRDDGVIEFLGRADHQIKFRGMRVELGEIEARLESHPAVRRAVVVQQDAGWLAAYVEPAAAADAPDGDTLAGHLGAFLPAYMVPSSFTMLEKLPIAPSGKVDRKALPAPERRTQAAAYVAPSTPTEQALAELWAGALGVERVGAQDDFFALGGHSLSAVQLVGEVRRRWGDDIPLRSVFEHPTVARFARMLDGDAEATGGDGEQVVTLATGPAAPPLVLAHPIGGTVFCYRDLASALEGSRTVWGLEAPAEPPADFAALASWHCDVLTAAQPEGPYAVGGWSMGGVLAYEMARQLVARGAEVTGLYLIDAFPPTVDDPRADPRAAERRLDRMVRRLAALGSGEPVPDDLVDAVGELLASFGVPTAGLAGQGRDDLLGLLRGWHATVAALARYEPEPADVHAHVLVASAHDAATVRKATGAWKALARGGCTVDMVEGDHITVLAPGNVETVVARIREHLDARTPAEQPAS